MKTKINYFPFTDNADSKYVRQDILQNPQRFVQKLLTGSKFQFGVMEITSTGAYKEQGYYYVVRPFLKEYIYEKYGQWHSIFALNKTNARKLVGGRITRIVNVGHF